MGLLPFLFHFLNMSAVLQHQLGKIQGGGSAVNGSFESFTCEAGKETGMVDMGMGEQNKVHLRRAVQFGSAVAFLNGRVALVHAAVHGKTRSCGLNHVT